MKKILALAICAIMAVSMAGAQDYDRAIGLRLGGNLSITYKQAIQSNNSLEILVDTDFDFDSLLLTGLYEWNWPVIADGFNLYAGVGPHIGLYSESFAFGISGIIGLEYTFPSVPIALSIDYIPGFTFYVSDGLQTHGNFKGIALGVKFYF